MPTTKHKRKLGFCRKCGESVFFLPCKVPGIGVRQWWHNDFKLDKSHRALEGGRSGTVVLLTEVKERA